MRKHRRRGPRIGTSALDWASNVWAALDTPRSLTCHILARYKEWRQLVELSVSPIHYVDPVSFLADYQATKLLSKYPFLDTGINRKAVAARKFVDAETQCALTNDRFRDLTPSLRLFDERGDVAKVLHLARQKMARILGPVPSLEQLDFRFGPGANFGVRGDTSVYKKLVSPLECTFAFARILEEFLPEFPGWIPSGTQPVTLVAGSELTFVPKDAKTDRPICIEPMLNSLMQKGVGSYIRDRLAQWGVNLRDQSINQRLARLGCAGEMATVDFQSASDTIAYMLILELLPIDWVEFLDVSRSPCYSAEGNWYPFEKWSSMGNAYTFELETAVFYVIACASCEVAGVPYETGQSLHVYGDDVIIPTAAFALFLEASLFCGFTPNQEKSYHTGLFRESCGADWFDGHDVRPYLLKKRIKTLQDVYYVTNSTIRLAGKFGRLEEFITGRTDTVRSGPGAADTHEVVWDQLPTNRAWIGYNPGLLRRVRSIVDSLRDVHSRLLGAVPYRHRYLIPDGCGDVGFIADFDVACPKRDPMWDGWWVHCLSAEPSIVRRDDWPISYALYWAGGGTAVGWWDLPSRFDKSTGYSLRAETSRWRVRKHFVFGEWKNLSVKWSERAIDRVGRHRR